MKNTENISNLPLTEYGVTDFLAGPMVEGIGKTYAQRLVEQFGIEAPWILLNDPDKATNVHGLGAERVARAAKSLSNIDIPLRLLIFLFSCGVSETYIHRILAKYRTNATEKIITDPYMMVEDVWQLSFFTADKIGRALNFATDDPRRLRGALVTAVKHYASQGSLFATPDQAVTTASKIAGADPEKVSKEIEAVCSDGRLVFSRGGLYLPVFYQAEKEGALKLKQLASMSDVAAMADDIPAVSDTGVHYSPAQMQAIKCGMHSPVMVLTGGPGTGKTTVLRGIIDLLEKNNKKVILAAPTGRAAKRMTTLTGRDATTIHRLLGYRDGRGYKHRSIEADVLIIDEGSMMEQVLFNHLLQALRPGTRVILVGDVHQLPAIGAGDVLKDLIASDTVPVVHLDENFRQADGSLIARGAKDINEGQIPSSDPERDFMIVTADTPQDIHDRIINLITKELPEKKNLNPENIIVVTPQQIGLLGARQLNTDLQTALNPSGSELRRGGTIMRLGDPVMQTANSSQRGVYNGETGRITAVDTDTQTLEVTYSDGRKSRYARSELNELVLAYATTVHKLQGSEVPNMIFPITMAHKPMLYRNLLYTGVSRATKLCILVEEEKALAYAVGNTPASHRNSNFGNRLKE